MEASSEGRPTLWVNIYLVGDWKLARREGVKQGLQGVERIRALSTDPDQAVHRPEGSQGPGLQDSGLGTRRGELQPAARLFGRTLTLSLRAQARRCKVFTNLPAVPVPLAFTCGAPPPTPPSSSTTTFRPKGVCGKMRKTDWNLDPSEVRPGP